MNPTTTDPNLIEAAWRREPWALDQLVQESLPRVLAWCAQLGGPSVDHEDAAHDVFVVVITKLHHLRRADRYDSWLFGITRRILAAHRRRAWVKRWVPGLTLERVDESPSPQRHREMGETSQKVQLALEKLPAAQREVLVLVELQDLTLQEASVLLDIPLGTAKSRLRLAKQKFGQAARSVGLEPMHLTVVAGGGS